MKGFLCTGTIKNNDEYRIVVKNRIKFMCVLMLIGLITAAAGYITENFLHTKINEHMLGVYTGVGVGFFVSGLMLLIKNIIVFNNEEKLKECRLSDSDERIQLIGNKAFRVASYTMIAVLYAVALIGGLLYPVLVYALLIAIFFFIATYAVAYQIYSRRM